MSFGGHTYSITSDETVSSATYGSFLKREIQRARADKVHFWPKNFKKLLT